MERRSRRNATYSVIRAVSISKTGRVRARKISLTGSTGAVVNFLFPEE